MAQLILYRKLALDWRLSIAGLLCFLAYFPTFLWMWERWFTSDSYYSHGILIPCVSAFLIWQKRHVLRNLKKEHAPWGLGLFIAGMVVHLLSLLLQVYFTSAFSLILVLSGFILYVYGKSVLKEVLFPLLFLGFMVPLPLIAIVNISFQLKLFSAKMAAVILNWASIPAIQEGSYIKMPHANVIVEDVCSGLRSLIALIALAAVFAHQMKAGVVKKLIVFFAAVPIAVFANTFRIALLAMVGELWGTGYLSGFIHGVLGILTFIIAFVLLFTLEKLLE